jgi:hypothetical protein
VNGIPSAKGGICTRKEYRARICKAQESIPSLAKSIPGLIKHLQIRLCFTVYMTLKLSEYSICCLHLDELKYSIPKKAVNVLAETVKDQG